jgi:ABC-type transport system involved in multi-copper enzyme maturation permease subunit
MQSPVIPVLLLADLLENKGGSRWNPLYARESRLTTRQGRIVMVYVVAILGYASILAVPLTTQGTVFQRVGIFGTLFTIGMGLAALFLSVLGGQSIAVEREEKTLDVLLSTRLSNREIVIGKFTGILRSGLLFMIFLMALVLGQMWSKNLSFTDMRYTSLVTAFIAVMVYMSWVTALGIFFSSGSKTASRAVGLTISVCAFFSLGLYIAGRAASGLVHDSAGLSLCSIARFLSPVTWVTSVFDLHSARLEPLFGIPGFLANQALYMVFSLGLLWGAVYMLGRSSQRR